MLTLENISFGVKDAAGNIIDGRLRDTVHIAQFVDGNIPLPA